MKAEIQRPEVKPTPPHVARVLSFPDRPLPEPSSPPEIRSPEPRSVLDPKALLNPLGPVATSATAAPRTPFPFAVLPGGLPRGAVTELSGPEGCGKTELLLQFLAKNPSLRAAWVENKRSIYPSAFPRYGVSLTRVLFVEAGTDTLWATQQVLRSQLFPLVVVRGLETDANALTLRRLQLAAEQAHAAVVLLPEHPTESGAWPICLQAHIPSREAGLRVTKAPDRILHVEQLFQSRRVS